MTLYLHRDSPPYAHHYFYDNAHGYTHDLELVKEEDEMQLHLTEEESDGG